MSIFDVLKCPISVPPTKAELEAIPPEVFKAWTLRPECSLVHIQYVEDLGPPKVAAWMRAFMNLSPSNDGFSVENDVRLLRRMIREYESV